MKECEGGESIKPARRSADGNIKECERGRSTWAVEKRQLDR